MESGQPSSSPLLALWSSDEEEGTNLNSRSDDPQNSPCHRTSSVLETRAEPSQDEAASSAASDTDGEGIGGDNEEHNILDDKKGKNVVDDVECLLCDNRNGVEEGRTEDDKKSALLFVIKFIFQIPSKNVQKMVTKFGQVGKWPIAFCADCWKTVENGTTLMSRVEDLSSELSNVKHNLLPHATMPIGRSEEEENVSFKILDAIAKKTSNLSVASSNHDYIVSIIMKRNRNICPGKTPSHDTEENDKQPELELVQAQANGKVCPVGISNSNNTKKQLPVKTVPTTDTTANDLKTLSPDDGIIPPLPTPDASLIKKEALQDDDGLDYSIDPTEFLEKKCILPKSEEGEDTKDKPIPKPIASRKKKTLKKEHVLPPKPPRPPRPPPKERKPLTLPLVAPGTSKLMSEQLTARNKPRTYQYRCIDPNCLKFFPSEVSRDGHYKRKHLGISACFNCEKCQRSFTRHQGLVHHQKLCGLSKEEKMMVLRRELENKKERAVGNIPALHGKENKGKGKKTGSRYQKNSTAHSEDATQAILDAWAAGNIFAGLEDLPSGDWSNDVHLSMHSTSEGNATLPLNISDILAQGREQRTLKQKRKKQKYKKERDKIKKKQKKIRKSIDEVSLPQELLNVNIEAAAAAFKSHFHSLHPSEGNEIGLLPGIVDFGQRRLTRSLINPQLKRQSFKIRGSSEEDESSDSDTSEYSHGSKMDDEMALGIEPADIENFHGGSMSGSMSNTGSLLSSDDLSESHGKVNSKKPRRRRGKSRKEKESYSPQRPRIWICAVYACGFCKKPGYKKLELLRQHLNKVHPELATDGSTETNPNSDAMEAPVASSSVPESLSKYKYYCASCKIFYETESLLEQHVDSDHKCKRCPAILRDKGGLHTHIRFVHERVTDHECEFCEERFMKKTDLIYHLLANHYKELGVEPLECKICGRIFDRPPSWNSHMTKVHKQKPPLLKCTGLQCRLSFCHQSMLTVHIQRVHEKPMVPCDECQRSFHSQALLRKHKRSFHNPEGKGYRRTVVRTPRSGKKKRTPQNEEIRYPCDVCGKQYKAPEYLREHKIIYHTLDNGEIYYRYMCDSCGATFASRASLCTHKKRCRRTIGGPVRGSHFKRWRLDHNKPRPWTCDICKATFTRLDSRQNHIKHVHKMDPPRLKKGPKGPRTPKLELVGGDDAGSISSSSVSLHQTPKKEMKVSTAASPRLVQVEPTTSYFEYPVPSFPPYMYSQ